MDVNKQINIRLVQVVEKYPCLYNSELEEYSKRECTESAWIEVAEELSSTPDVVKEKWKNFRSVFVRRLKEMQMGALIKPYYLNKYMQFVVPYLQRPWDPESREKRLLEESEKCNSTKKKNSRKKPTKAKEDIEDMDDYYEDVIGSIEENMDTIFYDEETKPLTTNKSNYGKRIKLEDDDVSAFSDCHQSDSHQISVQDNAKLQFVLSLLPDLEEMTNAQMRHFKMGVVAVINDILRDNSE